MADVEPRAAAGVVRVRRGRSQAARERALIRAIVRAQESLVVRLYSRVRFLILRQPFLEEIEQYLPRAGRVLDLGCGFGLFSLYFAGLEPGRRVVGVDVDARRVRWARLAAARLGLDNAGYEVNDALDWKGPRAFDAITLLDLVHHLPREQVSEFLEKVSALLRPGGVLLLKDVSDRPAWKRLFTLALDRLMVGREPIHYWAPRELARLLERRGFDVKRHAMRDFLPYPHVLYVCRLERS